MLSDPFTENIAALIQSSGATRIVVRRFFESKVKLIDTISDDIESLWVEDEKTPDDFIFQFPNLIDLNIIRTYESDFFTRTPNLVSLGISKAKGMPKGIEGLKYLKSLSFGDECYFDSFARLTQLNGLETLSLRGRAASGELCLEGLNELLELGISDFMEADFSKLGSLPKLRDLSISSAKNLSTTFGISNLPSLQSLWISSSKELQLLVDLDKLIKLKRIILERCPNIKTLSGLKNCKALEKLLLWETTKILDGDIACIKEIKSLSVFQGKARRHYNMDVRVLESLYTR